MRGPEAPFSSVFGYFGVSTIRNAAEVATPPITQGMPEFDLPGHRERDAADRQRPLPDLSPEREVALRARALALQFLDRGKRLVAHLAGLDRFGRLDDLA